MKYDYLVVGSGLYGSVFAKEAKRNGRSVLVIEKQKHVGGNVASQEINSIQVHAHGPHIFHTKSKKIWEYVTSTVDFWPYRHRVKARFGDKLYSLPFNMNTFYEMWGCTTPLEAAQILSSQRVKVSHPSNLEEQALALIGGDLYHTLVYGYTKKQWMRDPKELPASIIRRLPIRFTFNEDYFDDWYQGIPCLGYNNFIEKILDGVEVKLCEDFFDTKDWRKIANRLVYSGSIDELFEYSLGYLEYRGLEFRHEEHIGDFQGCAQMNYTSFDVPFTRITEHKHFDFNEYKNTVISYEYPTEWVPGKTRYYPIGDVKNRTLFEKYEELVRKENDIIIGGRLGKYIYADMDVTIGMALVDSKREFKNLPNL